MAYKPKKFRSAFGYDVEAASDETAIATVGPSKTVQSMAEDADINVIVSRFGITGRMPDNPRVPTYGDFTGVSDYQSAMNAVLSAQEAFYELPANVRARFDNDPQKLMEFVHDDVNLPEARALGLLKERVDVSNVGSNAGGASSAPGQGSRGDQGAAPGGQGGSAAGGGSSGGSGGVPGR